MSDPTSQKRDVGHPVLGRFSDAGHPPLLAINPYAYELTVQPYRPAEL
jgi:hypothetical protein